jgi:hypothetical protein
MKPISIITFLMFAFIVQSNAGTLIQDSVSIVQAAKKDAHHFKYNKADKKLIKKNLNNPNSDYFKPTSTFASQQSLLSDSLYVKSFKYYALEKIKARRSLKVVLIVTGCVAGVMTVIAILAQGADFYTG